MGNAEACIIYVLAPSGFALRTAQHRLEEAMPAVGIKTMERHRDPWWACPGCHVALGVALGIVAGIAMVFIPGLLRPLVARMRGALG